MENNNESVPQSEPISPPPQGHAIGPAKFWSKFPTPEARSQYMKERWAKRKEAKAKKTFRKNRVSRPNQKDAAGDADEQQASLALHEYRILLRDVLDVLSGCNSAGRSGEARTLFGKHVSRKCLMAADSLLQRGIRRLDITGADVRSGD